MSRQLTQKKANRLTGLKSRMFNTAASTGPIERVGGFDVRFNDGPNYYMLVKDIFHKRIYHFDSSRSHPLILDCGSNIGMSVLYFKGVYPHARIVAFEPDPTVLPYLKENIERNGLESVTVVEAALDTGTGEQPLVSDGKYGSAIGRYRPSTLMPGCKTFNVRCVRLYDYLCEPVDFLKMNIEGAEFDVLYNSAERLRQIAAMVIEYHHLPGVPRSLHRILELLESRGFDFLINDFDEETNPRCQPPFRLEPGSSYYLLLYAQRRD